MNPDPPQPKKWYKNWKVIVGGIIVLIIIGGISKQMENPKPSTTTQPSAPAAPASAPTSSPVTAPSPTPITVTAAELFRDYEANEVAADEKYKGKMIGVQGTVKSIGKDIVGSMYITLSTEERYGIMSVQCMFDDEFKNQLAQLKKGQNVMVSGRLDGKMGNVILSDCHLLGSR